MQMSTVERVASGVVAAAASVQAELVSQHVESATIASVITFVLATLLGSMHVGSTVAARTTDPAVPALTQG